MADSKTFSGFPVQNLSSDSTSVGQIYYNTSSGSFKAVTDGGAPIGTWASGGNLNTARTHMGQAGTQTASLVFAGNTPPSSQLTEKYDGTSWSVANAMTETARDQVYSFGTQTAAICASGVTGVDGAKSKLVEEWGGVSWTAGTDNNTARQAGASAGASQTSGIMYGGNTGSHSNLTESWNGNSWTQVGVLNTAGSYIAGGGTQTSALCSQGGNRPAQNESWNGSSWTEIAEQNTFRGQSGGAADSNTAGLIYGGEAPPYTAKTEAWNGTTWTEVSDLATATGIGSGGSGGQTGGPSSALAVGGQAGPGAVVATTQEWTAAAFEVKTLTTS